MKVTGSCLIDSKATCSLVTKREQTDFKQYHRLDPYSNFNTVCQESCPRHWNLCDNYSPSMQQKEYFALKNNFRHITSSLHFSQSNGLAERTVQTMKQLISKSDDWLLVLLVYRATLLSWCGYNPAQLLMGRNVYTNIPHSTEHLFHDYLITRSSDKMIRSLNSDRSKLWWLT